MTRALRQELKMSRPFATPEAEVLVGLLLTSEALKTRVNQLLKEHGLSEPQYNVLRILRGAAGELPCVEVGARMITRVPDITRLVDRLEDAGLVSRERCTEDRRVVRLGITPEGRKLLGTLDEPTQDLTRDLLGHLTRKELHDLSSLLDKARRRVAREG